MDYSIIIEKATRNYCAYSPDLPGCVATGATLSEVRKNMREAIEFHLEGMIEDGLPIPKPSAKMEYITVTKPKRAALTRSTKQTRVTGRKA